jgi:hypothetical protein
MMPTCSSEPAASPAQRNVTDFAIRRFLSPCRVHVMDEVTFVACSGGGTHGESAKTQVPNWLVMAPRLHVWRSSDGRKWLDGRGRRDAVEDSRSPVHNGNHECSSRASVNV